MNSVFQIIRVHRAILTKSEKKYFAFLSIFSFVASLFDVVGIGAVGFFLFVMTNPVKLFTLPVIGSVIPKTWSFHFTLSLLGVSILLAFFLKTVLNLLLQKILVSFCTAVGSRIRVQLMEKYLFSPYSFLISIHTTDVVNNLLNYVFSFSATGLVASLTLMVNTISICTIVFFLFLYKPLLTIVMLSVFLIIFIIFFSILRNKLHKAGEVSSNSNLAMMKTIQECFFSIKEIRTLSKERFFLDRIKKLSKIHANAFKLIVIFQRLPFYLFENGLFGFIIVLCLVEISFNINPQSVVALCGVLVSAGVRLLPSLTLLTSSIASIQGTQCAADGVYHALFDHNFHDDNELWHKNVAVTPVDIQKNTFSVIQLENVCYQYAGMHKMALQSITFEIKRGQSIGIIGTSGAGKSTLIDLILGLLTPTQGKILVDNNPITHRGEWVSKFAYIPQIIYLFDASLKQNITFGDEDDCFDETRFQNALTMAQLNEVVTNLPDGVETIVGENGVRLSGGQRQRIALARAFYHERDIIVMDEATAALDIETEKEVVRAINSLHKLKTLIIIAHRHSTVSNCDIIYRLENGRIIKAGSYEDMLLDTKT